MDLDENYYRNRSQKIGYLAEECKKILQGSIKYKLFTGKFAPHCLPMIGEDIDFLILDTVHSLPGELLDFLACYPYLKRGSVVILHDIALNHLSYNPQFFATKLLLDMIVAEKIVMQETTSNIGAFIINEDTDKYIEDIFSALSITWAYEPGTAELAIYREFYEKYYPHESIRLFDAAVELNQKTLVKVRSTKEKAYKSLFKIIENVKSKRVYIYGFGKRGKLLGYLLELAGIQVEGYIISDGQNKYDGNKKIFFLSEVCIDEKKDIILGGVNKYLRTEISTELDKKGIIDCYFPDDSIYSLFDGQVF